MGERALREGCLRHRLTPLHPATVKHTEKDLLSIYRRLSREHQASLLDFARFLESSCVDAPANGVDLRPLKIPRPEAENVVAAIKRLTATYPMLETSTLLDDVSILMSQHLLTGRGAKEVIDELETLFKQRHEQFIARTGRKE